MTPNFENALNAFVAGCQKIVDNYLATNGYKWSETLLVTHGKRYVKIVKVEKGFSNGSVYCFIDTNGDVLKSASYTAPAKGARGNIFNSDNGLSRMGPHGAGYNR